MSFSRRHKRRHDYLRRLREARQNKVEVVLEETNPEPATDPKEREVVKETEKPKKASQKASKTTKSKKSK